MTGSGRGGQRSGRGVVSDESVRDDVERELEAHVRMRADELAGKGWPRDEAEAEARRLLGDRDRIAQSCEEISKSHQRAVRRANVMDAMMQDLKYGVRTLLRSPAFASVAVVTLALGIGANTAIFSVVDGVLLEPLPYPDAHELLDVRERRIDGGSMSAAWPNFVDWRSESTVFEELSAYSSINTTVLGGEAPLTATVSPVSVDLWAVFGARPVAGRLTVDADHRIGAEPVAVVSETFWRNELAGRPLDDLRLDMNGVRASVVGVLPSTFDFPMGTAIWQPLESLGPQSSSRTAHNWQVVGRVADGVPLARVQEEMDALTLRVVQEEVDADPNFLAHGAVVQPLQERLVGSTRAPLLILLGAAGLVLLIACTNLASTMLARGATRTRELAVRSSLGAGRGRLVRQLVTESVILAAAGAVAGVGLGSLLVRLLRRVGPTSLPRLQAVSIDGSVLLFTALVAGLTAFLFGLYPAFRLARGRPVDALRQGTRGNAAGGRGFAWTLLVGTEVALAVVLIVGSGLLVRSFQTILAVDAGFDASDVVTTPVTLSRIKYEEPAAHADFYRTAVEALEAEPGVASAGIISTAPLGGYLPNGRMELDGDLEKHTIASYVVASAGAFEALDIPLLRGRLFEGTDGPDAPHVAIVSESFAEENWPGEDPIGRSVTGGGMDNFWEDRRFAEVVGVVGDVRYVDLAGEPRPIIYFPYSQRPFRIQYGATMLVEAAGGDASAVGGSLRSTLERLDPDIPLELSTQEEVISASMASREFTMMLLGGFSALALILAVVGIYGVVSYSVATRTREMGIRLALGADRGGVVQLVVRSAMGMVVAGLVVGGIAAFYAGRLLEGMLYQIEPGDPLTLVGGLLVLGLAGLTASWIPALLGTRVDPMVTMRGE